MSVSKFMDDKPFLKKGQIPSLEIGFQDSSLSYDVGLRRAPDLHGMDTGSKSTSLQASFTLFCSFVGVSILSIPYSFSLIGLGFSIVCMIAIGFLTHHCLALVIKVAEVQPANERLTLEHLTHKILGNWAVYVVQVSVSFLQVGICTVILMFASNFLDYAICNLGVEHLCANIPFRAMVMLFVTVPLTMINNMHWFYITSLFSTFFIMIGLATQLSFNFSVLEKHSPPVYELIDILKKVNVWNLPQFLGVAVYTFEGIGTLFSVRSTMKTPADFPHILKYQMIIIVMLFITFPAICYLTFQDDVPEIMIFTLPIKPYYMWIEILLVASALCGYSLQLFPTLKILENSQFLKEYIFDDKGHTKNRLIRYGLRIVIVLIMMGVVFSGLSFNLWISFIGSFASTFIGFMLPVLLFEKQFRHGIDKKTRILNKISFYTGATIGVFGVIQVFKTIFGSSGDSSDDVMTDDTVQPTAIPSFYW